MPNSYQSDLIIVGGGIVGLATAWRFLERFPDRSVAVLEKEDRVAAHQTGHNSGVLHTGVYYKPGSMKAENCRAGKLAMQQFCDQMEIPYELCGKVIVAVEDWELPLLDRIYERGQANGVACEMIDRPRLLELEPHAAGIRAIHVPEAGIIDYAEVCRRLADALAEKSCTIHLNTRVGDVQVRADEVIAETSQGAFHGQQLVNCAGLHCDRVAKRTGKPVTAKIVPFRGEFYELKTDAFHLVKGLIYPVPDPSFPFLGVHFTKVIDGTVECGPNAVLAFAREGYTKTKINLKDLAETLTYGGFLRLALKHWRVGCGEMWRSFSKRAFVKALQRLVPDIRSEHLHTAPAGVRAQAVSADGKLVDDFLIAEGDRVINIGNAPSPAATSSLNIGKLVVDRLAERFE